jgi:hypothetical protein
VRSWQPLLEAVTTPAALQSASPAAAAGSDEQQLCVAASSSAEVGEHQVFGADTTDSRAGQPLDGQQPVQQAGPDAAAIQPGLEVPSSGQPVTGQPAAFPPAAAAAAAAAAGPVVPKSKPKASKLFICPKAQSFLPSLPDTTDPLLHQQALLDVVALAEALYPPTAAAAVGSGGVPGAALEVGSALDAEVLALLGLPAAVASGPPDATASDSQQQQQQQRRQGCVLGVAEAFKQQLAGVVGAVVHYPLGSWLPNMTADVAELLLQHQAWTSQHPQRQQQHQQQHRQQLKKVNRFAERAAEPVTVSAGSAVGAVTASQLGMLKFVAGDVKGFLQAAAAADSVTDDVVALSAAGGAPAFGAAARLAAAKLAAAGDHEAAAVHLKAAGDGAVEGAALT